MTQATSSLAARRYSLGAIILHWTIALLIVGNVIGALYAEDLPKAEAQAIMNLHKATGLLVLTLSVLRIVWRLTHRPPPYPPEMKRWEVTLARGVHALLYVLMISIPLTGWLFVSAATGGQPVDFYGLFGWPGVPLAQSRDTAGLVSELHEIFAFTLIGLWVIHVAGALKHMFAHRFFRMWPGRAAALPG